MKIMFAIDGMSAGGAERVVSILANEMINNNDVTLILTSTSNTSSYYSLDKRIKILPVLKKRKTSFFIRTFQIRKKIIKEKPDVIISFLNHVFFNSKFYFKFFFSFQISNVYFISNLNVYFISNFKCVDFITTVFSY